MSATWKTHTPEKTAQGLGFAESAKKSETTALKISEKAFQETVIEAAGYLGWMHFHVYDSRRSDPGFPDLVLVRAGRLIFAELKSDSGTLSGSQRVWLEALRQVPGIEVFVWRPSDWDAIREAIL